MTDQPQPSATRSRSRRQQLLGLAMMLAGVGIIFAGEFEVLPRGVLTSALGAGVMAGGFLVHARARIAKA